MINLKKIYLPKIKSIPGFHELFESHISGVKGWLSEDEAQFLYQLAKDVKAELRIVEIGSYEGKSTISLALGSKENVVIEAVDPHKGEIADNQKEKIADTYDTFLKNINAAGVTQKIIVQRKTSLQAAMEYSGVSIGLLFIDGWHSTQAVLEDIDAWIPYLHPEGIVVFDDWNHEQVRVAIAQRRGVLPELLGAVGKDLAFTNSKELQESALGKDSKAIHKRLIFLGKLSEVKSMSLKKLGLQKLKGKH
jgi:predicted O-methyltransferase YrrM